MRAEVTKDLLEEVACCIVDNELNRDEACEYAVKVIFEEANKIDDAEIVG